MVFNVQINGIELPFERTVVYKYNDDVKGEVYNYLDIVPEVTTSIIDKVLLFKDTKIKYVGVKIKAGMDAVKGNLQRRIATIKIKAFAIFCHKTYQVFDCD